MNRLRREEYVKCGPVFPTGSLAVILVFVLFAAIVAVHMPAKRIRNMAITETINELKTAISGKLVLSRQGNYNVLCGVTKWIRKETYE